MRVDPVQPCEIHALRHTLQKTNPPTNELRGKMIFRGDGRITRQKRRVTEWVKRYTGASEMNESLRRGDEDYPSGRSKGLSEAKLRVTELLFWSEAIAQRDTHSVSEQKVLHLSNDGISQVHPEPDRASLSTSKGVISPHLQTSLTGFWQVVDFWGRCCDGDVNAHTVCTERAGSSLKSGGKQLQR